MMRRSFGILFTSLSAASLVVSAATVLLWVRSYFVIDQIYCVSGPRRYVLNTAGNRFALQVTKYELFRQEPQGWRWNQWPGRDGIGPQLFWYRSLAARIPSRPTRLGFWWGTLLDPNPVGPSPLVTLVVIGPVSPLALPWTVLPAVWLVRRYRRVLRSRRQARGCCPEGGYDLRATPGRCPECGMVSSPATRP